MPSDPMQVVVMLLAFVAGSGMIDRDLWPYIFYYIVAPALSGFVGAKLLETIPSLGMDFGLDRYIDYIMSQQFALAKAAGIGVILGFIMNRAYAKLTESTNKKPKVKIRKSLFDDNVSIARRKHLKTLGLTNSAGPRDMFLAWTKLSAELQGPKWQTLMKERGLDCSEDEFKDWIDDAYKWLRANSNEPVSVAKKVSSAQPEKPVKKKRVRSYQKSNQPKMQIRGL